jgi:hypothetical protein
VAAINFDALETVEKFLFQLKVGGESRLMA